MPVASWEITGLRDRQLLVAIIVPPGAGVTFSFTTRMKELQLPPGSDFYRLKSPPTAAFARNNAARLAVETKRHLALLDLNIIAPADTFIRLLDTGLDLVAGLYFEPWFPHRALAFNDGQDGQGNPILVPVQFQPGTIFPATYIPAGLTIYRRRLLESCLERWPRLFESGVDVVPVPGLPPFADGFVASWRAKQLGFQGHIHSGILALNQVRAVVGPKWLLSLPAQEPTTGAVGVLW